MPSIPSFVNGFVQISAVNVATLRYVVMAQDSTSLSFVNTAFRRKNRSSRTDFLLRKVSVMKSYGFLFSVNNRRLTLTAVQGILWRFSLF